MQGPLSSDAEHTADGLVRAARTAARTLAGASSTAKDDALRRAADALRRAEARLLEANASDLERTKKAGENAQVRVPIGVVLSIYESRPNVTADSAGLCLKTANACLLKSGSESQATSGAIADAIRTAIADAVQLVTGGRDVTRAVLRRDDAIDVVIARGGEALKRTIIEESRIPVVKHFEGICHLYVDAAADRAMAERICLNGKVQRPSVCNALENLLVHEGI